MISNKLIENSVNSNIYSGLTSAGYVEALKVADIFSSINSNVSVANTNVLPSASNNTGRLVYVESEGLPYYSDGEFWSNNISTTSTDLFLAYGVGAASYGRLGDNTTIIRSSPVTVVGGFTDWSQVSAGEQHSLGIANGIAYAWGRNSSGQVGDGTTTSRSSPVTVVGGITNWTLVSGGNSHSLGIADNVAYSWGLGLNGQLGSGSTSASSSPGTVVGAITGWSILSAGQAFSLGIANNVAYAWGVGTNGRLGDNTTTQTTSPVTVIGAITDWTNISAGRDHSLGIANGIAYAWGRNNLYGSAIGSLGDGTGIDRSSPVTVVGGITDWVQVSGGQRHSLGITDTGVAYAWGNNESGRLGDGTIVHRSSPVTVVGGITNWTQVSAGNQHSVGIAGGVAYAWGASGSGQLGTGNLISRSSPVTIIGGITNWLQVSASIHFFGSQTIAIGIRTKGFDEA